jgi:hypothetical protein
VLQVLVQRSNTEQQQPISTSALASWSSLVVFAYFDGSCLFARGEMFLGIANLPEDAPGGGLPPLLGFEPLFGFTRVLHQLI